MLCSGAEKPKNWGSGADFANKFSENFPGGGILGINDAHAEHASDTFSYWGYYFKPAMEAFLKKQTAKQGSVDETNEMMKVGPGSEADCSRGKEWYDAKSFLDRCKCEVGVRSACGKRQP